MDHTADVGSVPSGSAVVRHQYISIAKLAFNNDISIDAWQQEKRRLSYNRKTNLGSVLSRREAAGKPQFLLVKDVQTLGSSL